MYICFNAAYFFKHRDVKHGSEIIVWKELYLKVKHFLARF